MPRASCWSPRPTEKRFRHAAGDSHRILARGWNRDSVPGEWGRPVQNRLIQVSLNAERPHFGLPCRTPNEDLLCGGVQPIGNDEPEASETKCLRCAIMRSFEDEDHAKRHNHRSQYDAHVFNRNGGLFCRLLVRFCSLFVGFKRPSVRTCWHPVFVLD